MSNPFVDAWNFATRNSTEYVSGTSVERETVADVAEEQGYDSGDIAGVGEDWEPEEPQWQQDGEEWTEENTPDNPVAEATKWAKILAATAVAGIGLYLLRPLLSIAAGVLGD